MSQVSSAIKATLRAIPVALATTIALAALRPASADAAESGPSNPAATASTPDADQDAVSPNGGSRRRGRCAGRRDW